MGANFTDGHASVDSLSMALARLCRCERDESLDRPCPPLMVRRTMPPVSACRLSDPLYLRTPRLALVFLSDNPGCHRSFPEQVFRAGSAPRLPRPTPAGAIRVR